MSDFAALVDHVRQIETVLRKAEAARRLPNERAAQARQIEFHVAGYSSSLSEAQKIIANRMRESAEVDERRAGEVARDRELKRLAVELETLRQALPDLAVKARFDLCDTAREMRAA